MAEYIVNTDAKEERWKDFGAGYCVFFKEKVAMFMGNPVMEEIVRCKDCKYYCAGWCSFSYPSYPKHPTLERCFCAWGERRAE